MCKMENNFFSIEWVYVPYFGKFRNMYFNSLFHYEFSKKKIRWPTQYKKQEMFQKHLCPPWCKIQVYLLCRSKTCTKQVIKGLKYIKWTTYWAQKSSLTLTFEHVTWKSIGMIYSLRATPEPSMVLIKWRGQKILRGQHTGLRRVVWPWPLNMWPQNQ